MKLNQKQQYLATNNKARYNYTIGATYEAGMVLTGTEIKSIRIGQINISDGFIQIRHGEAWLSNVNIAPYVQGNQFNHEPLRMRRLLLHKREIKQLEKISSETGVTIVPLKVYIKNGFAKILIGIGTGKHRFDKREVIKKRDQDRNLQRKFKNKIR